jgi:hypothetical protein
MKMLSSLWMQRDRDQSGLLELVVRLILHTTYKM